MLNKFKRRHKVIMFISALLVIASIKILSLDNIDDANAWWNADMWINNSFREQNPSNWNVIAALFGNWYPWSSPYNRYWNDFCLPNKITYVHNMDQIQNMVRDTIYVIEDWFYYIESDIIPADCSAIIWKWTWEVILSGGWIKLNNKTNVILDNLIIEWNNIQLNNTRYSTLNNIEVKDTQLWIKLYNSHYNRLNRIKSHNNSGWIYIYWNWNFISESELFNNNLNNEWYGIWIYNSENNIINNCQIYNNNIWISMAYWLHNSINNSQIYNNRQYWAYLENSNKNLFNNSNIYSNDIWIHTEWKYPTLKITEKNENLMMSGNIYNNNIAFESSDHNNNIRYYYTIWLFANDNNNNWVHLITWGYEDEAAYSSQTDLLVLLRPAIWKFETDISMNRFLRTYPVDKRWIKFITPLSDFMRWNLDWDPVMPIKYIAWKEIIKQVKPLWYAITNKNNWWVFLNEHNPNYFIASIDSETSELDDSIINYYYWNYTQESEFTKNWNEKNCNINVMTVEYIEDQTWFYEKLLAEYMPLWHTIYVLWDWLYNVTDSIKIENDCTAIVNYKWSGSILRYYPWTNSLESMIYVDWHENIIFDKLSLDGNRTSKSNILLDRYQSIASQNSTINNIQSSNSLWDGIELWMLSNYNTIMNSQVWNNEKYGIDIYLAWEHNIINNSISYNNQLYWIRFGNKSKYNSINNSQVFNNGIGWIFSDLNTESNIINNVHSYNNTEHGLNFKRSSWNTLNNVYSYNNGIWINIEDDSAINNIYISDLYVFANHNGNLYGTNWHDTFLRPGYIHIPWLNPETIPQNTDSNESWEWESDDSDVNLVADLSGGIAWTLNNDSESTPWTDSNDEGTLNVFEEITRVISWYYYNWNDDPAWTNSYSASCTGKTIHYLETDFSFGTKLCEPGNTWYEDEFSISNVKIKDTEMDDYCEYKISGSMVLSFESDIVLTGLSINIWDTILNTWERSFTGWNIYSGTELISSWNYIYTWTFENSLWLSWALAINYTTWENETGSIILSWFQVVFVDHIPTEDEIYLDLRDQYWFEVSWKALYLEDSSIFVLKDNPIPLKYPLYIGKCSAIIWQENSKVSLIETGESIINFKETARYSVIDNIPFEISDGDENKILHFYYSDTWYYSIINNNTLNDELITKVDSNINYEQNETFLPYIKFLPKSSNNTELPIIEKIDFPRIIVTWLDMSCQLATNVNEIFSSYNQPFFENNLCSNIWVIWTWSPTNWFSNINYIFGLWISKQVAPVWYIDDIMKWLQNQYITTSFIWETNPILYTDPGNIIFSWASSNQVLTWINYEIWVSFTNRWVINHNFDIRLRFNTPDDIEWHIEIKKNWERENIWLSGTDLDYKWIEDIRIIIKTPDEYLQEIEWTLYIWTEKYGNSTENFWIQTIAEPIAPSIIRLKNIKDWWVREDWDNIRQIKVEGKYTIKAWYDYVDSPNKCNSGITMNEYNDLAEMNIKDYTLWTDTLNKKYVCIYAKDIVNGQVTTWVSNQIKISSVTFVDDIIPGPSYYDSVGIHFENTYAYGYNWVINQWRCSEENTKWINWIPYEWNFIINSDKYNNKYLCVKAEDSLWNKKFFTSRNSVNIIWHGDVVYFEDWINPARNNEDTISIWFSDDVEFIEKSYKRVSNVLECTNTWWMTTYNKPIIVDNKYLNGYYFCLYTLESGSLIENYLISPSPLRVDSTNPTNPTIISPNDGDNVYYLVIELTWAYDSDAGIAGYEYQIANDSSFMDIIDKWFIAASWNIISPKFDAKSGYYTIRIRAIDKAGNISESRDNLSYIQFYYDSLSWFAFEDVTWADLWKNYLSNNIHIQWLWESGSTYVEITNWILYRNWVAKWSWTMVVSGDALSIRMQSSNEYDKKVVSELIIFNRIIPRSITTKWQSETSEKYKISDEDAEAVKKIFDAMINMYSDEWERMEMFYTMKSMLKDEIALNDWDIGRLQYMAYLIENYLNDGSETGWKIHTAPNCKKYEISYDSKKDWYYSPDMMVTNWKISYFATVTDLLRFIDSKNIWWECGYHIYKMTGKHINTNASRHVAPNWKLYTIEYTKLWYTSPELAKTKYFASIYDLRSHINTNNPTVQLLTWDHIVDADSSPETYTAPNWKEYVIYHTNKWYMSYKFMSVRYFESLDEMKLFIDKNNKK